MSQATPAMCACFLPGCHLCFRSPLAYSGEEQARCECHLPGCPICNADGGEVPMVDEHSPRQTCTQFLRATHLIGGSGRPLGPDLNELISVLEFELERMLEGEGPQYLKKGPDWEDLPTRQGSRLDMLVAHLCHCGIRSVQAATMLATRAESAWVTKHRLSIGWACLSHIYLLLRVAWSSQAIMQAGSRPGGTSSSSDENLWTELCLAEAKQVRSTALRPKLMHGRAWLTCRHGVYDPMLRDMFVPFFKKYEMRSPKANPISIICPGCKIPRPATTISGSLCQVCGLCPYRCPCPSPGYQ